MPSAFEDLAGPITHQPGHQLFSAAACHVDMLSLALTVSLALSGPWRAAACTLVVVCQRAPLRVDLMIQRRRRHRLLKIAEAAGTATGFINGCGLGRAISPAAGLCYFDHPHGVLRVRHCAARQLAAGAVLEQSRSGRVPRRTEGAGGPLLRPGKRVETSLNHCPGARRAGPTL